MQRQEQEMERSSTTMEPVSVTSPSLSMSDPVIGEARTPANETSGALIPAQSEGVLQVVVQDLEMAVEEISSAPSTVTEEKKENSTSEEPEALSVPVSEEVPMSQQHAPSSSQPVEQQGQQKSQSISVEEDFTMADGKQSPAVVAQRVVHMLPLQNIDGSVTYMLFSLENGSENAPAVIKLDQVEPVYFKQGGKVIPVNPNLPMNPTELEGIFLDKKVKSARQIVSAIVSSKRTATCTTETASVATSIPGQSTIVILEGATKTAADGGQIDGDPVTQVVIDLTEDDDLVGPQ